MWGGECACVRVTVHNDHTIYKNNIQISERVGVPVTEVKNVIIWGNHSSTQYPDVNHATVSGKPVREVVKDDEWLNGEFITTVQQRGAAIIKVCFVNNWLWWYCVCCCCCCGERKVYAQDASLVSGHQRCAPQHPHTPILGPPIVERHVCSLKCV